jgi:hypothetical protein
MPTYAGTAHTGEKLKKQDEGDDEVPKEEEELIEFPSATAGPQFTCFAGTKVHILTQLQQARSRRALACFTGTKVHILTQLLQVLSLLVQKCRY